MTSQFNHKLPIWSSSTKFGTVYLNGDYNNEIEPGLLPSRLKTLVLGAFDKPLEPGVLPAGLTEIWSLVLLTTELKKGTLPSGLTSLRLGDGFEHKLEVGVLPPQLELLLLYRYDWDLEVGLRLWC